jgi:hypothetical protein
LARRQRKIAPFVIDGADHDSSNRQKQLGPFHKVQEATLFLKKKKSRSNTLAEEIQRATNVTIRPPKTDSRSRI